MQGNQTFWILIIKFINSWERWIQCHGFICTVKSEWGSFIYVPPYSMIYRRSIIAGCESSAGTLSAYKKLTVQPDQFFFFKSSEFDSLQCLEQMNQLCKPFIARPASSYHWGKEISAKALGIMFAYYFVAGSPCLGNYNWGEIKMDVLFFFISPLLRFGWNISKCNYF